MCLEFIFGLKKIVVYFLFPVVTWTKMKRAVDVGGHKVVGGIPAEHHGDGRLGVILALFGVLHSSLEDDFFGPWIVRQIRFVIDDRMTVHESYHEIRPWQVVDEAGGPAQPVHVPLDDMAEVLPRQGEPPGPHEGDLLHYDGLLLLHELSGTANIPT